ncbi:MAG: hypothetical protein H0W63_01640 [Gemmatimonadaceae bacterium]|nr:hypothetical protein [Gemmatimonadaceae bacterium]
MPLVPFEGLPDTSRTWVFAADHSLSRSQSSQLLNAVDEFLSQWKAHGSPLTVGRNWRDDRFLTVAVDQSTAGASGCSIDGLFRILKSIEGRVGASLVASGMIFYRDNAGAIQSVNREDFVKRAAKGDITDATTVFDPTVATLAEWRAQFQTDVGHSWHGALIKDRRPQPA